MKERERETDRQTEISGQQSSKYVSQINIAFSAVWRSLLRRREMRSISTHNYGISYVARVDGNCIVCVAHFIAGKPISIINHLFFSVSAIKKTSFFPLVDYLLKICVQGKVQDRKIVLEDYFFVKASN